MTIKKITPPKSRPLIDYNEGRFATNNITEACWISKWWRGTSVRHKFVSLCKAVIVLQANFRRKRCLALLSDEDEDRLLCILENFIRYMEKRLQETEDALFDAMSQRRV
jgi:hypothetical protein